MGTDIEADAGAGDLLRGAWDGLLVEVNRAFDVVLNASGDDDVDAAEGFRHLLRVVDACVALDVEHGDRHRPELFSLISPTRKIYFDSPDVVYEIAQIRGNATYRLHGTRGSARHLSVAVYGTLNGGRLISSASGSDLVPGRDGTIDLQLGGGPPPGGGRWLPLDRDADAVVVRQYFTDLTCRSPARLLISPAGAPGRPQPLSEAGLAYDLVKARGKVALAVRLATALGRMGRSRGRATVLEPVGEDVATPFGAPFGAYVPVWFRLEPDEALVVDGPAPEAAYWGAHLVNRWGESLDHENRQVSRNLTTTTVDADGRYRYVVSHRPVDHPNWLDACGHREGFVILRCVHGNAPGPPEARIVPVTSFHPPTHPAAPPTLARLDDGGRRNLRNSKDALVSALRRAADRIDEACQDAGADPIDRAEGYRSLTRLLSTFRETVVERGDQARPVPIRVTAAQWQLSGDNPDVLCDVIPVARGATYRMTGTRGSHERLTVSAYEGRVSDGSVTVFAHHSDPDIDFDEGGRFELLISSTLPPDIAAGQTWLPVTDETTTLVVRQQAAEPAAEPSTSYVVEQTDPSTCPAPLTSSALGARVHALARTVERASSAAIEVLGKLAAAPNEIDLDPRPPAAAALYPAPDDHHVKGWFQVAPGEALIVEGSLPASCHWSIQLWNRWGEALDRRYHTTGIDLASAKVRSDGTYRFVLAHEDPGGDVGDWIDLAGHREGVVCLRWTQSPEAPALRTRLVEMGSLR